MSQNYVNNSYIGKSGFFPPKQFTSGELSSAYTISPILLNTDKPNELLITLWVNGKGSFSTIPYIGLENDVFVTKKTKDFLNSNIFLILSVVLLVISFIYFLLFLFGAGRRSNLSFSRVTFFSAFYLTTVSLGEYSLIFEGTYSFLLFEKIFNGIMAILTTNYAVSFIRDFLKKTDTKKITIFRKFIVFFAIFLVLLGDDLNQFYSILNLCYVLMGIHILYAVYLIIKSIREKNNQVVLLLSGFSPVLISLVIGVFLVIFQKSNVILTIVVGWQLTILSFLTILIYNFSKTQKDYENLNKNLEKLISERTLELTQSNRKLGEINTKLKYENERTEKEITLATNVQKNFFIHNFKSDDNWEVAYFSEALAGVSGDFYDFYTTNPQKKLDGLGVFDVSGHGISAGLVTMLAKNIIRREYQRGISQKRPLSKIMEEIDVMTTWAGRARPGKNGEIHIFSRKVYCSVCGKSLQRSLCKSGPRNNPYMKPYLHCRSHRSSGGLTCDNTSYIRYEVLEEIVLNEMNKMIEKYYNLKKLEENYYSKKTHIDYEKDIAILQKEKEDIEKKLNKISDNKKQIITIY